MKNGYKKPITILWLVVMILLVIIVGNQVYSVYKNQQLLTKDVIEISYGESWMSGGLGFEILVEDGVITAEYTYHSYMDDTTKIRKSEWSEEKFTSYLTELKKCGVLSWKEEYGKGYEDRITDQVHWNFYIAFSDGTDFRSYGYYVMPNTYDKFMDITREYFSEED